MSIVVDLPAPFGPSSATVSPRAIETSTSRTARTAPCGPENVFTSPRASMPASEDTGGLNDHRPTLPATV